MKRISEPRHQVNMTRRTQEEKPGLCKAGQRHLITK
jgi:hypothetical protein